VEIELVVLALAAVVAGVQQVVLQVVRAAALVVQLSLVQL